MSNVDEDIQMVY